MSSYLAYQPSLDTHAALIATSAVLIVAVAALAFHSRRVLFASLLATSLLFQSISYAGMLVLRFSPESREAATAVILGSLIGPAAVAAALIIALPLVAVLGTDKEWSLGARGAGVSVSLGVTALARTLGAFLAAAVVVMTAGSGLVVQKRNTIVVTVGLTLELLAVIPFAVLSAYFTFKAVPIPPATSSKEYPPPSPSHYWFSQTKTWATALNLATGILLTHLIYRIIEQSQGLQGALFASPNTSVFMVEALPLIAIAVSTVSPPLTSRSSPGGEMATPAWPAYNDASRPNTPTPTAGFVTDIEMARYGRKMTPSRGANLQVQTPARGHARNASSGSESTALVCLSPAWDLTREQMPIVTVNLNSVSNEPARGRESRWKWGGRGKKEKRRDVEDKMVMDNDELW